MNEEDYKIAYENVMTANKMLEKELDKFRPFTSAYEMKKEIEKLELELDSTNSTLKKYADKLIMIAHLHDHYFEYDYRDFDKLLEEVLYND